MRTWLARYGEGVASVGYGLNGPAPRRIHANEVSFDVAKDAFKAAADSLLIPQI